MVGNFGNSECLDGIQIPRAARHLFKGKRVLVGIGLGGTVGICPIGDEDGQDECSFVVASMGWSRAYRASIGRRYMFIEWPKPLKHHPVVAAGRCRIDGNGKSLVISRADESDWLTLLRGRGILPAGFFQSVLLMVTGAICATAALGWAGLLR